MKKLVLILCLLLTNYANAETGYDPKANPEKDLKAALVSAEEKDKLVLVIFGADWCPDCRSLNKKIAEPPLAKTIDDNFSVIHVDVGRWDNNIEFASRFGKPIEKGIPSIAILDKDQGIYYVAQGGEFATARNAKVNSLNDWFEALLKAIDNQELEKRPMSK
ncbi:thioredoxin family protein [Teredinibacter turnerae]